VVARTPWPARDGRAGVGIVTVHFETPSHLAQLVYSLYRLLGPAEFETLVVVDNGSRDGSLELLRRLAAAGLLELIENEEQRYHGPGLTQGISWLAEHRPELALVWTLDSDVVVLRRDTLRDAADYLAMSEAAAVGEPWDDKLCPHCLLFDPGIVWRDPIPPFLEHGEPSLALQHGLREAGERLEGFPFEWGGYIAHVGRATLRHVAEAGQAENRYYEWARRHHAPYLDRDPDATARYEAFLEEYRAAVPSDDPDALIAACRP
jgi:glycosyltransferase involved in cell wall biosynthesis